MWGCILHSRLHRGWRKVYVTNWPDTRPPGRCDRELYSIVVDPRTVIPNRNGQLIDARTRAVKKEIEVGLHPSGWRQPSGDRLYVANANSDTCLSSTRRLIVVPSISVRPGASAHRSSPNALP